MSDDTLRHIIRWNVDFFAMQDLCGQRYQHWLQAKRVPETYSEQFPFCVETYLHFIYQYDAGTLRDVSPEALAEFFLDYVLRVRRESAK